MFFGTRIVMEKDRNSGLAFELSAKVRWVSVKYASTHPTIKFILKL